MTARHGGVAHFLQVSSMAVHTQPFVVITANANARERVPLWNHASEPSCSERSALLEDDDRLSRGRSRYRSDYGSSRSSNSSLRTLRPTPVQSPHASAANAYRSITPPTQALPTEPPPHVEALPSRWARLRVALTQLCCLAPASELPEE